MYCFQKSHFSRLDNSENKEWLWEDGTPYTNSTSELGGCAKYKKLNDNWAIHGVDCTDSESYAVCEINGIDGE